MTLISHWEMDDNTSTTRVVESVSGFHGSGSINTTLYHHEGRIGQGSLYLSGGVFNPDKIVIDNPVTIATSATTALTIAGWFEFGRLSSEIDAAGQNQAVFYNRVEVDVTGVVFNLRLHQTTDDKMTFHVTDQVGNSGTIKTLTALTADTLHHIACVWNGPLGNIKMYLDNVLQNTASAPIELNPMSDTQYQIFGANATDTTNTAAEYAEVKLDDWRIYKTGLTLGEISGLWSMKHVLFLNTATDTFLNLQSGLARPYWEVNITVSGSASTFTGSLGQSYDQNDIISVGVMDRAKPIEISGLSRIIAGSVTIGLDNSRDKYSPLATASIFTETSGTSRDWIQSKINVWAGFKDTSGTAYAIQRGAFLLTKLRIDSHDRKAYFTCEDAARIPLQESVGTPDLSGTATIWTPPSGSLTKQIMTELLSAVGLSSTQYDIASGLDFPNFALQEERVSDAVAKLAQANDGFVFTDGSGKVVFRLNQPTFTGATSDLVVRDTDRLRRIRYTIDNKNLINKVTINYTSGLDQSRTDEDATVTKGRFQSLQNEIIDRNSIAVSLGSKLLSRYKKNISFVELDGIWLPSLEVGDVIDIHDKNTHTTAISYEVYRIREDITNLTTKIYGIDLTEDEVKGTNRQKWAFASDTSAVNCGTVFTASWNSGFGFVCRDIITAVNPAFDADGNNNNAINTGVTVSGAGGTGIELPFIAY